MSVVRLDTELLSWWLFLLCAVGFTIMAVRDRDPLFIVSTLFFAAACVVFLAGRNRA
tara:strand:- start:470 stop:640 length:171 start_codon:yes stop_codon:yes gene_type:complete